MQEEKSSQFGSIEATNNLWLLFKKSLELLDQSRLLLAQENSLELPKQTVLNALLYAATDTSRSILHLAHTGHTRDSFVLARTAFETIVNICFVCAKGNEVAKRADRHADQKAYRDLTRILQISEQKVTIKWQGNIDLDKYQNLKESIAEFTSKKGREITSWTPETVEKEIEAIGEKYGNSISLNLQFALIAIYRHASEIAHGTYFGALFALGMTSPDGVPESREELETYDRGNMSMVLLMLSISISSLLSILAKEMPFTRKYSNELRRAINELKKEPWTEGKIPT
jgi:Family of unknown function (DUF5677)